MSNQLTTPNYEIFHHPRPAQVDFADRYFDDAHQSAGKLCKRVRPPNTFQQVDQVRKGISIHQEFAPLQPPKIKYDSIGSLSPACVCPLAVCH
jgi:hypothetical protein